MVIDGSSFAGFEISDRKITQVTNGVNMGAYGLGGSGKTTMFAEAVLSPHGTPMLLVDIDGTSDAVLHLKPHGLDIVKPKNWSDFDKIHTEFKRGKHEYKSYFINNLSVLQQWILNSLSGNNPANEQIQHYKIVLGRFYNIMSDCTEMAKLRGINTFYVLWEETEVDKITEITRHKVNLFNKLGATLPGLMPMLARLTVVGDARLNYARVISFAPNETVDSKSNISPTDVAAKIPLEVWWARPNHFMVDYLATIKDGVEFPVERYTRPKRQQ